MPSLLPEDECGAQQDPRHVDGRLQVLGVGELAVDAHADGDAAQRTQRTQDVRTASAQRTQRTQPVRRPGVLKLYRDIAAHDGGFGGLPNSFWGMRTPVNLFLRPIQSEIRGRGRAHDSITCWLQSSQLTHEARRWDLRAWEASASRPTNDE